MAQTKEGAEKIAAQFCGITVEKYRQLRSMGLKRCTKCKVWKPIGDFNNDKSRGDGLACACRSCQNKTGRDKYIPVLIEQRRPFGPKPIPERDGDKIQARATANRLKKRGKLPDPNIVHCKICGHIGADRTHEYHHHNGYGIGHHADVIVLCGSCHHTGDLNPKIIHKNEIRK